MRNYRLHGSAEFVQKQESVNGRHSAAKIVIQKGQYLCVSHPVIDFIIANKV